MVYVMVLSHILAVFLVDLCHLCLWFSCVIFGRSYRENAGHSCTCDCVLSEFSLHNVFVSDF